MKGRIEIGRVTKKQQRVIHRIVTNGLHRYYYNDCQDIETLAIEFGLTNIDIIGCIQYVEVKMFGKYSWTDSWEFNCHLEG